MQLLDRQSLAEKLRSGIRSEGQKLDRESSVAQLTPQHIHVLRLRLASLLMEVDRFAQCDSTDVYNAETQRMIVLCIQSGLRRLNDDHGTWLTDPREPAAQPIARMEVFRASPAALVGFQRRPESEYGHEFYLEEIMSESSPWDDDLNQRIAQMTAKELVVSSLK